MAIDNPTPNEIRQLNRRNSTRYLITDGTWFLTRAGSFVYEWSFAAMFVERDAAIAYISVYRYLLGTAFKIRRVNLNTGSIR